MYNLTPRQFHNRLNGWREQQLVEYRERHEIARLTAFLQKIEVGKGKKQIGPTDVIMFPWETASAKSNEPSPEAIREMSKGAKEVWGMKLAPRLEKFVEGDTTD